MEVDSNHRSKLQQIYSLSPLATRESTHMSLDNDYLYHDCHSPLALNKLRLLLLANAHYIIFSKKKQEFLFSLSKL